MGFNKKFYEEAELEIAQRQINNKMISEQRQNEILSKFPQYRDLLKKLAYTGEALSEVFFSGIDTNEINEKLLKIETENTAVQASIKSLLTENGYPVDYLDSIFSCQKCKDSGIHENKRCSCYLDVVKLKVANEINKSSALNLSCFDTYKLELYPEKSQDGKVSPREIAKRNLMFCKNYSENFHIPMGGILMRGATGLGKTHLSLAIASEVINKGYSVIYGSVPDLLRKMENEHFDSKKEEDTIKHLKSADLIILDDLGAEFKTEFLEALLYDIINTRNNAGYPTIVNTNMSSSELKEKYNERLFSRLLTYEILTFVGEDIRIKKKLSVMS